MSSPTSARRLPRRLLVVVAAAVVLVAVIAAFVLTTGDDAPPSATSSSASSTASVAPTTVTAPSSSAPPATPTPTGPTDDVDTPPSELPPVGLQDEAETGGVSARLSDVTVVEVTGQGAGSVSGRAVRVTVEVANDSTAPVPLGGVDVTAFTGGDRVPAAPVDDGETVGLVGAVDPGGSAGGTYLFSLPDGATTVSVLVAYQAGAPVMVFSGDV